MSWSDITHFWFWKSTPFSRNLRLESKTLLQGKVELITSSEFRKANIEERVWFHLLTNNFTSIPLYAALRKASSITGQYLQNSKKNFKKREVFTKLQKQSLKKCTPEKWKKKYLYENLLTTMPKKLGNPQNSPIILEIQSCREIIHHRYMNKFLCGMNNSQNRFEIVHTTSWAKCWRGRLKVIPFSCSNRLEKRKNYFWYNWGQFLPNFRRFAHFGPSCLSWGNKWIFSNYAESCIFSNMCLNGSKVWLTVDTMCGWQTEVEEGEVKDGWRQV